MKDLGWIAIAGACGTLCRVGTSTLAQRIGGIRFPNGFPYGTLAVNLVGCFLFGLIWALAEEKFVLSGRLRVIFLSGFMGAFTTFSTFSFESGMLMKNGQWGLALANIAIQNILGIVFILAGIGVTRI